MPAPHNLQAVPDAGQLTRYFREPGAGRAVSFQGSSPFLAETSLLLLKLAYVRFEGDMPWEGSGLSW